MVQNSDWREKYQAVVRELDSQESEWKSLERVLLKAITRLTIAGRGFNSDLDLQLNAIQSLSREKLDGNLANALIDLGDTIAALAETKKIAGTGNRSESLDCLLEFMQGLKIGSDQQPQLKVICSDLLKAATEPNERQAVTQGIHKLSDLVNQNFVRDQPDIDLSAFIQSLFDMLELDAQHRSLASQKIVRAAPFSITELQSLADIVNSQISFAQSNGHSINAVMSSLLERLSLVQGLADDVRDIQQKISDGIGDDEWPDTLAKIAASVSKAIKKLNDEKTELQDLIRNVTVQLNQITQVVTEDHEDQLSSHRESLDLHDLMKQRVDTIKGNVDSADNMDQLKGQVAKNIELIRLGIDDFVHRVNDRHKATETRNKILSSKISQMEKDTLELQQKLTQNRKKLLYDTLTGVRSRLAYDEQIELELVRWQRHKTPFSYAILDIDHFKNINDKFGHNAGDKALKIIAQSMKTKLRKSDFVFRIGGEEFVLLLANTKIEDANALVNTLRNAISASSIHFKQERVVLTLSAGITEMKDNDSAESLYERADQALYNAKNSGRNCQILA